MKTYSEKYIREDVLKELLKHKSKYDVDENIYIQFCKNRINIYMKQIELKNYKIDNKYSSLSIRKKRNTCKCRTWSNGHGLQCSNTIKKNDLCKIHNNMIDKYGKLRYDTMDLPKPRHDLIDGKLLNWK